MGWAELSLSEGATDWRLFKRVMREFEAMRRSAPGLELATTVWYVNPHGTPGKWQAPTSRHLTRQIISFRLEEGAEKMVPRGFVFPDVGSDAASQLRKAEQHASAQARPAQQGMMPADKAQRIDAFFAKRVDDHKIDVHSEGQMMMSIVMNPGCEWECAVHPHPQPTLDDLDTSIALARERNLRVLRLAGHAKKTCGFIWNRDDKATASREFDVDASSRALSSCTGVCQHSTQGTPRCLSFCRMARVEQALSTTHSIGPCGCATAPIASAMA